MPEYEIEVVETRNAVFKRRADTQQQAIAQVRAEVQSGKVVVPSTDAEREYWCAAEGLECG